MINNEITTANVKISRGEFSLEADCNPVLLDITYKGIRDLLVIAISAALVSLAENAIDFGVPAATAPIVSAAALAIYRIVRDGAVDAS